MPRRTQVRRPLLTRFAYGAVTRSGLSFQCSSATGLELSATPYNPESIQLPVWAVPRSLATTEGIVSFPEGT